MNDDLFARLLHMDAVLSQRGFAPLSRFWKRECKRFLRGNRRRWVIRCGRRAGKSLTMMKLSLLFALFAPWQVAPGEVATIPFLSVERREAAARIRQLAAALIILNEAFEQRADEIELHSRPLVFRVVTASTKAVVGFTSVFVVMDEVARWADNTTGANPAAEIYASVVPTMSTIPSARIVLASSPWSESDFHARLFDEGENSDQQVSFAESWVGNPTLTAEGLRAEAVSELVFAREFAARPSATTSSLISKDEYDALVKRNIARLPPVDGGLHTIALDVGLRNDRTAIVVGRRELRSLPNGAMRDLLVVVAVEHLVPGLLRRISIEDVIGAVVKIARIYPGTVFADQHYFDAVGPKLREHGLRVVEVSMSPPAISARVTSLQAKLSEQSVEFVDHAELRKEVLGAVVVHHIGGRITCRSPEGRRGLHDDLLAGLLINACPEIFPKLRPLGGDIEVEYSPLHFDHETHALDGGRPQYFQRQGKLKIPCEPPFGSREFVVYAQQAIMRGAWTEAINRWCRSLGFEPRPDLDPRLLDPHDPDSAELSKMNVRVLSN